MIIEPKIRGFICTTAHPLGCEKNVLNQIEYVRSKGSVDGAKRVLVIGASTGFGLSSRIMAAFGSGASTIGVCFEKAPREGRLATAGWYNTAAFEKFANKENLYAKTVNGDAFSNEVRKEVIDMIKSDLGQIDLVIYSLASPKRVHPNTGEVVQSTLKPVGAPYTNRTVNFHTGDVSDITIDPATQEEINNTVTVMGGEDWSMWINALLDEGLLAKKCKTVAYSYVGPEVTTPIYRKGTIGYAKDDLEATGLMLNKLLKPIHGHSFVSVNKALVTQSSSAIPVVPLYISLLFRVMKEKNIHEGCIEQIQRLFAERLYIDGDTPVDEKSRIRIDDWEMREDVQKEIDSLWNKVTSENIETLTDIVGYRRDFMNLFGFEIDGVDYDSDVNEMVLIPSLT